MNNQEMLTVESRRGFLKKSAYMAPAIMMLGSLNSYATDSGDSKSPTSSKGPTGASTLKTNTKPSSVKGNNGYGNGDQNAPGESLNNNSAENDTSGTDDAKKKVNNVGVDTHGGHEKDLEDDKGNNGFGNGDQDAPGNSLSHNGAENNQH